MNRIAWFSVLVVAVGIAACLRDVHDDRSAEDGAAAPRGRYVPPAWGEGALNDRCFVCHESYRNEELSVNHAKADVGCERCHGPSDAHCADENNITPPDIMYPRGKINDFCASQCHEDWVDLNEEHPAVADGTEKEFPYCTDCHGEHRLASPRTRWNKVTRELLH